MFFHCPCWIRPSSPSPEPVRSSPCRGPSVQPPSSPEGLPAQGQTVTWHSEMFSLWPSSKSDFYSYSAKSSMFLAFLSSSPLLWIAGTFLTCMFSVSLRAPLVYRDVLLLLLKFCPFIFISYYFLVFFHLALCSLGGWRGVHQAVGRGRTPSAAWPAGCVTDLRAWAPVSQSTGRNHGGPSPVHLWSQML